jgi:SAM-dependent methyltransferase
LILLEQKKYEVLDEWFKSAQGRRVGDAFGEELKSISDHISGNKILQLGSFSDNSWLSSLIFRQKMLVSPSENIEQANIFALINNLPIEKNSIDCVLAPLTMEIFSRKDNNPLDEIDRVLKPHGYIIFFGINPCSFWGGAILFKMLPSFAKISVKLQSSLRLKHALLNRGYRQCFLSNFFYIPPVKDAGLINKMEFLNEMGKMIWPHPASFYCFIAQKYDPCAPFAENEQDDIYLAKALF